ncbi:hypothetical protein [Helicobacter ibis]|uniref:Uncharacterized protein n=1 Tax=Helicobacter ibis TaxID=2962633 RepID=A0ABT4VDT2_9HELI|nr:hypothetical protein [Helicobacter ibis]MDA3968328.1 hypothetical protein [Helicobacter ibis]
MLIKKAFIYPNDSCSNALVAMYKDLLGDFEAIFIDDRVCGSSLSEKRDEILNSYIPLLVCAGEVGDILFAKCKENGVNALCGREYAAKLLAQEFNKLSAGGGDLSNCFFLDTNFLHIKDIRLLQHYCYFYFSFSRFIDNDILLKLNYQVRNFCECLRGLIEKSGFDLSVTSGVCLDVNKLVSVQSLALDQFLKSKAIDTTLFFWDYDSYVKLEDKLQNTRIIIAPWILSDYFTPKKLVWMYGKNRPRLRDEKRIVIGAGHSVCEAFDYCPLTISRVDKIARANFLTFDYYLAIDKLSFQALSNLFRECNIPTIPLEAGSPSLDNKIKENIANYGAEYFYYIPKSTEISMIVEVIRVFLKAGRKIRFRPHMNIEYLDNYSSSNIYRPLEEFMQNDNFSIDRAPKITQESLARGIVITDTSSVSYSTPWSSLKPTLLFAPNKKEHDLRQVRYGFSFANPTLHRVGDSVETLLNEGLKLEKEVLEHGMELKENLREYRSENIYNLGVSQQKIEKILLLLLEKAESYV